MSGKNGLRIIRENVENLENNYVHKCKVIVDESMITPCRILNGYSKLYVMPKFSHEYANKLCYDDDGTKVLAFSGGKLSLACALRYKYAGKDVILFHVANRGDDVSRIKELSNILELPLYIHYEHIYKTPFEGMKVLYLATEYAIKNCHSPSIIFGNFYCALSEHNDMRDWKYCTEFISSFEYLAKEYIDGFSIINPILSYSIMWDELLKHKEYMSYLTYNNNVERAVFENARMDYRVDPPDLEKYISNIKYLSHNKKQGKKTLLQAWNEHFFYKIERSIFYRELTK